MKLNLLSDLIGIFYPDVCIGCKFPLLEQENFLCTHCLHDLPKLPLTSYNDNTITQIFFGKATIEFGFSLLIYRRSGVVKNIIQELKYKGNESIGIWLGDWIGTLLKNNPEFETIDYIVPVPLHVKKLKSRGYNQVSKFAKHIGFHLQIPVLENQLVRISSAKSQTLKVRIERFNNLNTTFEIQDPKCFVNKHVLLIDDVITTGATLTSCAIEFLKIDQCLISVLSMAYTE